MVASVKPQPPLAASGVLPHQKFYTNSDVGAQLTMGLTTIGSTHPEAKESQSNRDVGPPVRVASLYDHVEIGVSDTVGECVRTNINVGQGSLGEATFQAKHRIVFEGIASPHTPSETTLEVAGDTISRIRRNITAEQVPNNGGSFGLSSCLCWK